MQNNDKEENPFFTAFRTKQGRFLFIAATIMLIAVMLISKFVPDTASYKQVITIFGCVFMMVSVSEFMKLVGTINEQNSQNGKNKK